MSDPRAKHLASLSALLPGFAAYWKSSAYYNGSDCEEHTVHSVFSEASTVAIDLLSAGNAENIRDLLEYIEGVMQSDAQDERDAAATCFLENILNVTPARIEAKVWIPYLGAESRAFCRAWDDFTGCRTEYLHDDRSSDD
jgi:hypothetical protein